LRVRDVCYLVNLASLLTYIILIIYKEIKANPGKCLICAVPI